MSLPSNTFGNNSQNTWNACFDFIKKLPEELRKYAQEEQTFKQKIQEYDQKIKEVDEKQTVGLKKLQNEIDPVLRQKQQIESDFETFLNKTKEVFQEQYHERYAQLSQKLQNLAFSIRNLRQQIKTADNDVNSQVQCPPENNPSCGKQDQEIKLLEEEVQCLCKIKDQEYSACFKKYPWATRRLTFDAYVTGRGFYKFKLQLNAIEKLFLRWIVDHRMQDSLRSVTDAYGQLAQKQHQLQNKKAGLKKSEETCQKKISEVEQTVHVKNTLQAQLDNCIKQYTEITTLPLEDLLSANGSISTSCTPQVVSNGIYRDLKLTESECKIIAIVKAGKISSNVADFVKSLTTYPDLYLSPHALDDAIQSEVKKLQSAMNRKIEEIEKKVASVKHNYKEEFDHVAGSPARYNAQWETRKEEYYTPLIEDLLSRYDSFKDPAMLPVFRNYDITSDQAGYYSQQITEAASERVIMPYLPFGYKKIDSFAGRFTIPQYLPWQSDSVSGKHNFVINADPRNATSSFDALNTLLMNMLISFPAKKLKFTFVDLNMTQNASLFTVNLDSQIYHNNVIMSEQDLRRRLEDLQERMKNIAKKTNNILAYNQENKTIYYPYEVVVLLDYPSGFSPQILNLLKPLCNNGHKGGLFFVVMNNTGATSEFSSTMANSDILKLDAFTEIYSSVVHEDDPQTVYTDVDNAVKGRESLNYYVSVALNENFRNAVFSRINNQAQQQEKAVILTQPVDILYSSPLRDASADFKIAIGESNNNPAFFSLDEISHIHSFILGKSGSGKSVLMHNIISNAILTYHPDSLHLYLLDFKLGGVEFNHYKDVKHVKALLVDKSDAHITLEILRSLYARMKRQGEQLREAGVSSLNEYNRANPRNTMPRSVLVIDECHEIFKDRMDRIQSEINAIITNIAKEGRSQGVHLVMATQTLANSNIPTDILNNISDYYLLESSMTDAEKLVKDSSKQIAMLSKGMVLYGHQNRQEIFQGYYADKEQREKNISVAIQKSLPYSDEGRFIFSGKQIFEIDGAVVEAIRNKQQRGISAVLGKSTDVKQEYLFLTLNDAMSENVLLFGINNQGQALRVAVDMLITMLLSSRIKQRPLNICVIDCSAEEQDNPISPLLPGLEAYGCSFIQNNERGEFLSGLAEKIKTGTAEETVLFVLGQERFREVRLDMPLVKEPQSADPLSPGGLADFAALGRPRQEKQTYKSILRYILENGPERKVHTVLQLDKPGNLLFENVITPQMVSTMFRHIVMLKSSQDAIMKLRLSEDIKLESLSEEHQLLRAYHYDDISGVYTMFTPLMPKEIETFIDHLK